MTQFNRRSFLGASILGLSGLAARSLIAAQPNPKSAITFGFSLYGMRTLKLDAALQQCAAIGYNAVELACMPDWPGDPQRLNKAARTNLRNQLQQRRLALPALMENTPLHVDDKTHRQQLDRLRGAAELGHQLSPKNPPLIETILGGKVGQWETLRNQFANRLGEWAKLAEKERTIIAIKPHRFGAMNTPEQAIWLHTRVKSPWIKLAYDFSHFQHRNMTLAATLKTMLPQTRFVHVKDVEVKNNRAQFLLPGQGTINFTALLQQLRAGNYNGCVCVEVSGQIHGRQGFNPVATARQCYQNLAPAFQKAGIKL